MSRLIPLIVAFVSDYKNIKKKIKKKKQRDAEMDRTSGGDNAIFQHVTPLQIHYE